MLERFLILNNNIPINAEFGTYNLSLVLLSYVVASLASYIALDFAEHLTRQQKSVSRRSIHFFGAFILGAGIWSMHFIGMLAYQMKMTVSYDSLITFFSMLVAVSVAYFVLELVKLGKMTIGSIIVGAICLGIGICSMHYSGMMAMHMDAELRYTPGLLLLSVTIAIAASAAALLIALTLAKRQGKYQTSLKIIAALVMGGGICGMHYTGMAAAIFIPFADCRYDPHQSYMAMALAIGIITLAMLVTALLFSAELNRTSDIQSTIGRIVHRLFYQQTASMVVTMSLICGALAFWQLLYTQSKLENSIGAYTALSSSTDIKVVIQKSMSELSMVLLAITVTATLFISFIINLVRKRESEILLTKQALESQLKEKDRMEERLNAYVERMEITHYDMLQARMDAEKASQSKSDFLANMSHEIRTPMNGVLGMTGLLLDTPQNAEQRGWTEIIKKSGENLLDIINDILDFSKIEAGKLELELISFSLSDAVEEVTDVLRLRTQEKNIELLARFAPDTPNFIVGDPGRIRQILMNLIGNAIKFTEKGHILIDVRGELRDGKAHLVFEIQDTGIGIPEEKLNYIFQKFSQAEESTTRKFGGTGLGLAISKSLVEMMEGNIGVTSSVGNGSVFSFDILLPAAKAEEVRGNIPNIDLNGKRALVVDDYRINCIILYQYLQSWGMQCDVFTSGTEAFEAALNAHNAGNPYDIALMDHHMENMSGLELAQRIHNHPSLGNGLLVMVTSATQVATPEELKLKGVMGFLTKPFYPEQLKALLKIIIDAHIKNKDIGLVTRHMVARMMHAELQKNAEETKQYTNKRVLVVEDVKVNLMLVTKVLEKHGIRVDAAANGKEAVNMLEKFTYDLVLMDCQMPEMDGFEATKAIRQTEVEQGKPRTTIVALTADAMIGDREKCLKAGMDDYLNKPIKFQKIAELLEKWMGNIITTSKTGGEKHYES